MGNFKMTWLKVVHKSDTSEKRKKSNINEEDLLYSCSGKFYEVEALCRHQKWIEGENAGQNISSIIESKNPQVNEAIWIGMLLLPTF
jgi:hypothetical protein